MIETRLRGLYAVTDEQHIPEQHFVDSVERALRGGARLLQYRDKSDDHQKRQHQAAALKNLCTHYRTLLIINDDIELAHRVAADGVHLGKDDAALNHARHLLGENAIVGVSCYNEIERARRAEQQGADYVAFGSFFTSPTKPGAVRADIECLTEAKQQLNIPVCAIGGIDIDNAAGLVNHGADMIAVISGLFAQDDIEAAARKLSDLF